MPIFFNFHILLATFYTIFGTNILIQCPVPVPVCCMFFVSQNIHIKQRPNGIKTEGDFFGIFGEFRKKNQRETMREGATRQGAPQRGRHATDPRGHPVRWLMLFFCRKKANFCRKITPWQFCLKQRQSGLVPFKSCKLESKTRAKVFGKVDTTEMYQ